MKLLGVHMIGEQATDLVHIGMMAMLSDSTAKVLKKHASMCRRSVSSISSPLWTRCQILIFGSNGTVNQLKLSGFLDSTQEH